MLDNIGFRCDDCGKELTTFEHNYGLLEDKVIRTIQKNLRTGEWQSRINASKKE
jgi:hypothetical protein